MAKQLRTVFLSLLIPGFIYFQKGGNKSFYKTLTLFFSILIAGVTFRLFTTFWGLVSIVLSIIAVYLFTFLHAIMKTENSSRKSNGKPLLKPGFTIAFLLVTTLSFANRRTIMSFDIMQMDVPVMQPTLLRGERFLVDTWVNKHQLGRETIVVHSFNGQKGLYLNRIIATEGDRIEIKNGLLLINGQVQPERYVLHVNVQKPESKNMKALVVPKGHYFVMGDNRDASFGDSRFSGTVPFENIVAIPTDIISSPDNKSRVGRSVQ